MIEIGYRFISFGGLLTLLAIAFVISENRRLIRPRIVICGMLIQGILCFFILKTALGHRVFDAVQGAFLRFLEFSDAGAGFLFGRLTTDPGLGATVAFRVLPIIIFVSAVSGILYHLRIIQFVVKIAARLMQKAMHISGAESVGAALFVFLGIESVTAIKAYIQQMTRSELFVIMVAFMATIASSVMGAYVAFGAAAGHLLAASLMSAPAAVVIAKMLIPETGDPKTAGRVQFAPEVKTENIMDAAATGAADGMKLAINIAAMLIAFVGLVAMVDYVLSLFIGLSLATLFGYAFAPVATLIGVPFTDIMEVGELLGTKVVLNEFLAYEKMQGMVEAGLLTERGEMMSTYVLCGFANFGSIAILLGGLRAVAPARSSEIAALGLKALIAGLMATLATACFAGIMG